MYSILSKEYINTSITKDTKSKEIRCSRVLTQDIVMETGNFLSDTINRHCLLYADTIHIANVCQHKTLFVLVQYPPHSKNMYRNMSGLTSSAFFHGCLGERVGKPRIIPDIMAKEVVEFCQ